MPCYYPVRAWKSRTPNASGKYSMVFDRRAAAQPDAPMKLSCGQCVGCRLARSAQWAARCVHESSLYENNCFITLTYSDEHLPANRSLTFRHFQLFMKRLRKEYGDGIRFFHCGEYGEKFGRPHYHALLFNFDFPDRVLFKVTNGHRLYTSESLSALWPYGLCSVGDITFESAAYVARYIMKKVTGNAAESHYSSIDPDTGEVITRSPEYVTMSRRPGIGKAWFDKYYSDVFPHDRVVINGRRMRPPRYYDGLYELIDPFEMDFIKDQRSMSFTESESAVYNNFSDRLKVREKVQLARLTKLPRTLD